MGGCDAEGGDIAWMDDFEPDHGCLCREGKHRNEAAEGEPKDCIADADRVVQAGQA